MDARVTTLIPEHQAFHAHFEGCDLCQACPFALCAEGDALRAAAAESIETEDAT